MKVDCEYWVLSKWRGWVVVLFKTVHSHFVKWPLTTSGYLTAGWYWNCGIADCWTGVDCIWNVMAHAQKPDFVFRRNRRVHLNQRGHQFSRLLAAEVRTSAVVMVDTPSFEVVWRVLATHSIRQFPLYFSPVHHRVPSRFNWTILTFTLQYSGKDVHIYQMFLWFVCCVSCNNFFYRSHPIVLYSMIK